MKKVISIFFIMLLCVWALAGPVYAASFPIPESVPVNAASVYFLNLDTGLPIAEKNPTERRSVASLTKMMTALLLVEHVQDLDGTQITAPTSVFTFPVTGGQASHADIRPGEVVTARTLLYAMMLPSGNEAAAITAHFLGNENPQNFYAMMNARAKELGCVDTNFSNPHGLGDMDEGNYSTAKDMALIAQACWNNEIIRGVVGATEYKMPFTNIHTTAQVSSVPDAAYVIRTTNFMMRAGTSIYRSYIRGMKTGSTIDAGRCFASVAVNENGETYVGVVLGGPYESTTADGYAYSFQDTGVIYDWIFANFSVRPTLDIEKPTGEVPVALSAETDVVKLFPAQDLRTVLPNDSVDTVLEKEFNLPESVDAPIRKGDVVGTVTVKVQGEVIGTVDVVAGADVARSPILYAGRLVKDFFGSTYFYVVLVLSALFFGGYFVLMGYVRAQMRKKRAIMRRRQMQSSAMLTDELAPPGSAPQAARGGRPQGRPQSYKGQTSHQTRQTRASQPMPRRQGDVRLPEFDDSAVPPPSPPRPYDPYADEFDPYGRAPRPITNSRPQGRPSTRPKR